MTVCICFKFSLADVDYLPERNIIIANHSYTSDLRHLPKKDFFNAIISACCGRVLIILNSTVLCVYEQMFHQLCNLLYIHDQSDGCSLCRSDVWW